MLLRSSLLAATLLVTFAPALHAQAFEGVIRQRMITAPLAAISSLTGGGETLDAERVFSLTGDQLAALPLGMPPGGVQVIEMELFVRGGKLRLNISMPGLQMPGGMYTILDPEAGMVHSVMPEMRMVASMSTGAQGPIADMMSALAASSEQFVGANAQVTPLAPRTLHGFATQGHEVRGENYRLRMWGAPELVGVVTQMPGMPVMPVDPTSVIADGGFPMLLQMLTPAGGPAGPVPGGALPPSYMVQEVLSVERRTVDAALFEVPADYRRVAMPPGG